MGDSAIPESPLYRELSARGFSSVNMGELLAHNLTDYSAFPISCKDPSKAIDFYNFLKSHIIHNCPSVAIRAIRMASNFDDKLIFLHPESLEEIFVISNACPDFRLLTGISSINSVTYQEADRLRETVGKIENAQVIEYKRMTKKRAKCLIDVLLGGTAVGTHNPFSLKVLDLALDISMNRTGVAARAIDAEGNEQVVFGELRTKKTVNDVHRYQELHPKLLNFEAMSTKNEKFLINLTECCRVVVEGGALGAVHGAYRLGRHAGLVMSFFADKEILEIAPTTMKKRFTGYGHASKSMVIRKAKKIYGITKDLSDNIADALGLLSCL